MLSPPRRFHAPTLVPANKPTSNPIVRSIPAAQVHPGLQRAPQGPPARPGPQLRVLHPRPQVAGKAAKVATLCCSSRWHPFASLTDLQAR